MRLCVYVKFTLRDVPADFRGVHSESFTLGKKKVVSFFQVSIFFIKKTLEYYALFTDAKVLNVAVDRLRRALAQVHVEEKR
jgi:hypothetical protein